MQEPWMPDASPAWHGHWGGPGWNRGSSERPWARRARLLLPVFLSLLVQVPGVFLAMDHRPIHLTTASQPQILAQLGLALVGPVALLAARRFPGPVVAIVTVAASLDLFLGGAQDGPPYIALAFAIVGAIVRRARIWAWVSVAVGWVASLSVAALSSTNWTPFPIAFTTIGLLIVMGIGESLRTRRDRFERFSQLRQERQQSEIQAERVRIARELHDVLAHSLSQINVQAGVGLYLMDRQPDKARDALASIKETSKTALDEVRSVLGVLRSERGAPLGAPLVPEPDLSRVPGLAASVTAQGIVVSVADLPADVPPAIQLAMYRIVQESLTNVARHSRATRATVEFTESDGFYGVSVTDNGMGSQGYDSGGGRGLLGMRERAELLGGTLEAGPVPSGGFRVLARIPVRERVR